ncbi:helical backbone metal receptor [Ascidiimonas sp. W6]|uniref:ABC transporter substrate-binding protein n=1 Tax=Ascidiimonas meishanensis TaxID=3128903 RepID=UPI0030EF31E8
MRFKDQTGRILQVPNFPERIISLVPSQTELLIDLGLQDQIIGVTKFCVHPREIRKLKCIVGGTKQVHLEKIQDLKPDLILCNKEENTLEMVHSLEQIAPVHVSDVKTISDNLELILAYGELMNCKAASENLIEKIKKSRIAFLSSFEKQRASRTVLYFIWKNPWMAAGGDTFIHEMLMENNLHNCCETIPRYPEIDLKNLPTNEQPAFIFLSSEPYPFKEIHKKEVKNHFPDSKIILVNGEYFSWYGSRLVKAFSYFQGLQEELKIN